jgi:hypothetical protein
MGCQSTRACATIPLNPRIRHPSRINETHSSSITGVSDHFPFISKLSRAIITTTQVAPIAQRRRPPIVPRRRISTIGASVAWPALIFHAKSQRQQNLPCCFTHQSIFYISFPSFRTFNMARTSRPTCLKHRYLAPATSLTSKEGCPSTVHDGDPTHESPRNT